MLPNGKPKELIVDAVLRAYKALIRSTMVIQPPPSSTSRVAHLTPQFSITRGLCSVTASPCDGVLIDDALKSPSAHPLDIGQIASSIRTATSTTPPIEPTQTDMGRDALLPARVSIPDYQVRAEPLYNRIVALSPGLSLLSSNGSVFLHYYYYYYYLLALFDLPDTDVAE